LRWRAAFWCAGALFCLAACATDNHPPIAQSASISTQEDVAVTGTVIASDLDGDTLVYQVVTPPVKGTLHMDQSSGVYVYTPNPNVNGQDAFSFRVSDGLSTSSPASISISIAPVEDPPVLQALPDVRSLPDQYEIPFQAVAQDPDGDSLQFAAQAAAGDLAMVRIDAQTGQGFIEPLKPGETDITVTVTDGVNPVSQRFHAVFESVRREALVQLPAPDQTAVTLFNGGRTDIELKLGVNGKLFYQSTDTILTAVDAAIPADPPGDPFISSLWHLVSTTSARFASLTSQMWIHDPALFLNSLGFGLCDDRASVMAHLAVERGYTVRMWDLEGHVVPEFLIGGRWEVWDPDMRAYYRNRSGAIASMDELSADPSLITDPVERLPAADPIAYTQEQADKYSTTFDNRLYSPYLDPVEEQQARIVLPAGGTIHVFGIWADAPISYLSTSVALKADMEIDVPAGWSGELISGFVPVAVEGTGQFSVRGKVLDIGSPEAAAELAQVDTSFGALSIVQASGAVRVIVLVNPVLATLQPTTSLVMEGFNVGAIGISPELLPANEWLPAIE
jgi:hypothetical protein